MRGGLWKGGPWTIRLSKFSKQALSPQLHDFAQNLCPMDFDLQLQNDLQADGEVRDPHAEEDQAHPLGLGHLPHQGNPARSALAVTGTFVIKLYAASTEQSHRSCKTRSLYQPSSVYVFL
jgi:hypothetical protein